MVVVVVVVVVVESNIWRDSRFAAVWMKLARTKLR